MKENQRRKQGAVITAPLLLHESIFGFGLSFCGKVVYNKYMMIFLIGRVLCGSYSTVSSFSLKHLLVP